MNFIFLLLIEVWTQWVLCNVNMTPGVTYFARDPLRSYFDEQQRNEIYFLLSASIYVPLYTYLNTKWKTTHVSSVRQLNCTCCQSTAKKSTSPLLVKLANRRKIRCLSFRVEMEALDLLTHRLYVHIPHFDSVTFRPYIISSSAALKMIRIALYFIGKID